MIRSAQRKDVRSLFVLESQVFKKDDFALSLGSFYYHVKNNQLFVYEDNSKIIGYILWLKRKGSFRLYSLCIDSVYRRQSIGEKLLSFSLKFLGSSKYTLEVKTTNIAAIKLYEKYDFKIQKKLVNFYNDADGYLMVKRTSSLEV